MTIPPHIRDDIKEHLARYVSSSPDALLFTPARGGCHLNDRVFNKDVFKKAAEDVGREDLSADDLRRFAGSKNAEVATLTENVARLGHKTVGAALRYQHSQDGSAVGLPREQSPGDAEDRYQGNEGERDAEAKESARRVPTRLHHHQVRLMAERVEERKRDARADQRQ